MKLSTWAKQNGITYKAAYNWFKNGNLPIPATQLENGTILVHPPVESITEKAIIYARVSSQDQKKDLAAQIIRCLEFANSQKLPISDTITEIGSGLNGHRKKLLDILSDKTITTIVVEHKDRLMRFGFEYVEASLKARNVKVLIVDETELNDDLVQDMISILTSFCARLYGRRSAKNRAEKALKAASEE